MGYAILFIQVMVKVLKTFSLGVLFLIVGLIYFYFDEKADNQRKKECHYLKKGIVK